MVLGARVVLLCGALAGCDRVFSLDRPDARPDAPLPTERWQSVAGGRNHTCGIRLDHTLWCWGRNDGGQLALGAVASDLEHPEPAPVGIDADWESLSIGFDTACAIKVDHSLWCWGNNNSGQLGDGTQSTKTRPTEVGGRWITVSSGRDHTCAIDEAEALHCWGYNGEGRLGTGAPLAMRSVRPMPVVGGGSWKVVRTGDASTCGLRTDGTLWCWGSNDSGRLGLGVGAPTSSPAPLQVGTELWTSLALKNDFVCAIRDAGHLRCWGNNRSGQLGDRTRSDHASPAPVDDDLITDWKAVDAGFAHVCAIHGTGELACWGDHTLGQLASDPTKTLRLIPTAVEGGDAPWGSLGVGLGHTCAIDTQGSLWCAGQAADGALGTGEGSRRTPTEIAGRWERLTAGDDATCGFARAEVSLGCWGSNNGGLLGDGAMLDRKAPGALMGTYAAVDLGDHGCAIDPTGLRSCWGPNNLGQLGNGGMTGSPTPVQIGAQVWTKLSSARSHTCGITMAGALLCWGRNAERQTGQPPPMAPAPADSPVRSPAVVAGTWKDVGTGIVFSCGIKTDSKAYCWGFAGEGQLGNNSATPTSHVVVTVSTTQTFDRIFVGARHACALTAAGAAWCWGWNQYGQVGDSSAVPTRPVPVRVPGVWRALSLGEEHSCGIRSDGTLACWGRNHYAQLGDGTTIDQIDPTPVGSDTDWESVAAGFRHTCATKTDGRTLCWGGNQSGAVGDDSAWRATLARVTK